MSTRGAVGVLSPQLFTLLTGLPASMQVGSTGTGTPLTGVAVVSTPGTIVVDVTPQALSGVGAVGAIGNAGPMFNPGLPEVLVVTAATERAFATQPVQVAVRELAPQVLAVVKPTNVLIAPRPVQVPVITQEPEVDVGV